VSLNGADSNPAFLPGLANISNFEKRKKGKHGNSNHHREFISIVVKIRIITKSSRNIKYIYSVINQ
jgi:hypothetical protein